MNASAYDPPPTVVDQEAREIDKWIIDASAITVKEKHRAFSVGQLDTQDGTARKVVLTSHLCSGSRTAIASSIIVQNRVSALSKSCLPILGIVFPSQEKLDDQVTEVTVVNRYPDNDFVTPIEKLVKEHKSAHRVERAVGTAFQIADTLHTLCENGLSLWGHAIGLSGVLVSGAWNLYLMPGPNQIDWNRRNTSELSHHTLQYVSLVSNQQYGDKWSGQEAHWEDLRAFLVFLSDLLALLDGDQCKGSKSFESIQELSAELSNTSTVQPQYKDNEVKLFSRYLNLLPQWDTFLSQDIRTVWVDVKKALTNALASRIFEKSTKEFWRMHFPCQIEVPMDDLIDGLYQHSNLPYTRDSKCYQIMLAIFCDILDRYDHYECAVISPGSVTMRDLKNILAYFGPINREMLESIVTSARAPWFHGMVSKNALNEKLQSAGEGKFLIRFSSSQKGSYALSRFVGGKVESYIIVHSFGTEFVFAKHEFSSLHELVFHKKNEWKLDPCEGSPFRPLYDPKCNKSISRYVVFDVSS